MSEYARMRHVEKENEELREELQRYKEVVEAAKELSQIYSINEITFKLSSALDNLEKVNE